MAGPVEKRGLLDEVEPESRQDADSALAGVITTDLPCRTCGYNLRGLAISGNCPECNTANNRAFAGDMLRYSDPRWVRTIARGFRLQSIAVGVGLIAIIFATASRESLGLPWLVLAIALTIGVLALVGVWLATEREPAAVEAERWFSDRRLLRVSTIAGVAMQAGSGYFALLIPGGALYVRLAAGGVMVFGTVRAFRHAISLAQRIPDPPLVTETRTVMWGLAWSYGLFLSLFAMALNNKALPSFVLMAFGLSCTVIIACVIFTLWCLTLFSRYAKAMRAAAMDAQTLANAALPGAQE